MITFDAKKFMKALDNYVGFRSMTPPTDRSVQREREAEAQLLEQLQVLEDTAKTVDRFLLAQVEIAGLMRDAQEFVAQKEELLPIMLGFVVRSLEVLSTLEESGPKPEPSA